MHSQCQNKFAQTDKNRGLETTNTYFDNFTNKTNIVYVSNMILGTYGVVIPGIIYRNISLVSPALHGSSYQCQLAFSIWNGDAEISLKIHGGSVNRTVFVYTGTSLR